MFSSGNSPVRSWYSALGAIFSLGDAPGHVLDHQLLFGESEIHGALRIVAIDTNCTGSRHCKTPGPRQ